MKTASDETVISAVLVLCEFSLLVSQQHHSDRSLTALDNALTRYYKKKGIFYEQKMLKSVKVKVDDLLAEESHQLHKQTIDKIHVAMEALVYGTEKVSTTQHRQFQVCLTRA